MESGSDTVDGRRSGPLGRPPGRPLYHAAAVGVVYDAEAHAYDLLFADGRRDHAVPAARVRRTGATALLRAFGYKPRDASGVDPNPPYAELVRAKLEVA